jgi:RNA polymerase sigma-70 factor, ECF subfamily
MTRKIFIGNTAEISSIDHQMIAPIHGQIQVGCRAADRTFTPRHHRVHRSDIARVTHFGPPRSGSSATAASEADVVQAARAGDEAAWEQLYRASYPRLSAYAGRRAGPEVTDDIVAETWSRAIKGIDGYRWTPVGFDGWLFGIARRVIADHHRQAGKVRLIGSQRVADVSPAPGDDVEVAQDWAGVRRHFAELPDTDREILELRVIAGLSADQVGAVLGRRPGAVRTAQHRALAKLRVLVEADGEGVR